MYQAPEIVTILLCKTFLTVAMYFLYLFPRALIKSSSCELCKVLNRFINYVSYE